MADLIQANEAVFTPFEPKLKNRYIMSIDGIPAYLIKTANRPAIEFEEVTLEHINVKRYIKGKATWQTVEITLYDAVVPSAAQAIMEWIRLSHESVTGRDGYSDFYKKDVDIDVLGPVGDKVEIRTESGLLVGELKILEDNFLMTGPVYGNDWTTETIDGAVNGEHLSFIYNGNEAEQAILYAGTILINFIPKITT